MSIRIKRATGGWLAVVTPSPLIPATWVQDEPLGWRELTDRLVELGYHMQDISDAFHFADPDWMSREN